MELGEVGEVGVPGAEAIPPLETACSRPLVTKVASAGEPMPPSGVLAPEDERIALPSSEEAS